MHQPEARHSVNPTANHQPLSAAQISGALLKLETVQAITALSRSSIYAKMAAKDGKPFPQPIRMGKRCSRWRAAEVMGWIASQTN